MKIGFYITFGTKTNFVGVDNKINAQIKFFNKYFPTQRIIIEKEKSNIIKSLFWRLPFGSWGAKYSEALDEITSKTHDDDTVFFYIRSNAVDYRYLKFLKTLRKKYASSKILLEIPTYPYSKEYLSNKTMWPWYFKDLFYQHFLKNYVDRIVTFSDDEELFGIKTIRIMNGMDVSSFSLVKTQNDSLDSIKMIAVAMMQAHHGYERIINGLHSYYASGGKKDISIVFVGYGPELIHYQKLSGDLGLSERIDFRGKLEGEELEKAYDGCDLAIGTLAAYKRGVNIISSIKLGEYLAKGLPIITGTTAQIFVKHGGKYNIDFPNDPSEIDISKVIDFYNDIYGNKDKHTVHKEIREFAKRTIDIDITMKEVVDYLES